VKNLIPSIKRSTTGITPVFVLNHGRCGSKWLSRAMRVCCPGAVAVHEPPPMIKVLALEYYYGNVLRGDAIQMVRSARLPHITATAKYFKLNHYVEINRNIWSLAGPIGAVFPKSRFLGLVRDGRDFVTSMMNKNFYGDDNRSGKGGGRPYLENIGPSWGACSQVEKLALHWVTKCRYIIRDSERVFRHEDLTTSTETFKQMMSVVNIPVDADEHVFNRLKSKRVNRSNNPKYQRFSDLSLRDREAFYDVAGKMMIELGYNRG